MDNKPLIIGSSGYVGYSLTSRLRREKIPFATLNRNKKGDGASFRFADGEQEIIGRLEDATFLGIKISPSFIVNLAADVSKGEAPDVVTDIVNANSLLPALIGSQAKAQNKRVRILHLGTYSHKSDVSDYDPQTFYAASKYAGEKFLEYFSKGSKISTCVLHTYDIYGPHQPHERLIPQTIRKLRTGESIVTTPGEQDFRPLFIEDLVALIISSLEPKSAFFENDYNQFDIYGPETLKVRDVPTLIAKQMRLQESDWITHQTMPYSGKEIMHFRPCHNLPEVEFEWTTFEQGISKILSSSLESENQLGSQNPD